MIRGDIKIVRAVIWIMDYWPHLLALIGGIVMAAVALPTPGEQNATWKDIFFYKNNIYFFISAIALLFGNIVAWYRAPGIKSLQQKVAQLETILDQSKEDYFRLFENHLEILTNDKLSLSDNERVSVYKYEEDSFIMLGRYSRNPEYCKRGRGRYPANEGCIARAWQDGEFYVDNLPDPATEERDYYQIFKDKWGIKKGTAQNFKMKSRSYFGFAIENEHRQRIAVIVIESINPTGLNPDNLRSVLSGGEARTIANFIVRMKYLEPSLIYARKEGY